MRVVQACWCCEPRHGGRWQDACALLVYVCYATLTVGAGKLCLSCIADMRNAWDGSLCTSGETMGLCEACHRFVGFVRCIPGSRYRVLCLECFKNDFLEWLFRMDIDVMSLSAETSRRCVVRSVRFMSGMQNMAAECRKEEDPAIILSCGWCDADVSIREGALGIWPCGETVILCAACRAKLKAANDALSEKGITHPPLGFFTLGAWHPFVSDGGSSWK